MDIEKLRSAVEILKQDRPLLSDPAKEKALGTLLDLARLVTESGDGMPELKKILGNVESGFEPDLEEKLAYNSGHFDMLVWATKELAKKEERIKELEKLLQKALAYCWKSTNANPAEEINKALEGGR